MQPWFGVCGIYLFSIIKCIFDAAPPGPSKFLSSTGCLPRAFSAITVANRYLPPKHWHGLMLSRDMQTRCTSLEWRSVTKPRFSGCVKLHGYYTLVKFDMARQHLLIISFTHLRLAPNSDLLEFDFDALLVLILSPEYCVVECRQKRTDGIVNV